MGGAVLHFDKLSRPRRSVGIVQPLLDGNRKPVYAPAANIPLVCDVRSANHHKSHFDQWYRALATQQASISLFRYRSGDGTSFDDTVSSSRSTTRRGKRQNFRTQFRPLRSSCTRSFTYKAAICCHLHATMNLWVFGNGHPPRHRSGVAPASPANIDPEQVPRPFGCDSGQTYPADLFPRERHTTALTFPGGNLDCVNERKSDHTFRG